MFKLREMKAEELKDKIADVIYSTWYSTQGKHTKDMAELMNDISEMAANNIVCSLHSQQPKQGIKHSQNRESLPKEGEEVYPIALISPTLHTHKLWVNDFGIHGQKYTHVSRVDDVMGVFFSAIQPGLQAWKVDPDIVDAARDRVRSTTLSLPTESQERLDLAYEYLFGLRPMDNFTPRERDEYKALCIAAGTDLLKEKN